MKVFTLERKQIIPVPIEKAWDFFSDPNNLSLITPPSLDFKLLNQGVSKMYAGMILHYMVRPLFGIPVSWTSEITQVVVNQMFVDQQRAGPYRLWHHQHLFEEVAGGTKMTDLIHYGFAFPILDSLLNALVVRPRLEEIFDYRQRVVAEQFRG